MSNFTLNKTETCHYTMDVSIPAEEVNNSFRRARNAIRNQVSLKGFRKGRAPDALIDKRYAPQIKEEANRQLLETFVRKGLEENDVQPLTMPSFVDGKEGEVAQGQPFEFSMEFDVRPEFELPEYKGLELEKTVVEITDEQVDEFLNQRLESRASYGAVDRPAQSGDMLKASLKCDIDPEGEDVPDAAKRMIASEESWLLLSEPEMIPGIAEGLVGVTAGEEKELTVEFPDDYYEPFLAGKTVNYVFGIEEVQGKTIPELTEELAKEMGGESIEDIRSKISEHLKADADNSSKAQLQEQVTEKLSELVDFDLPPQAFKGEVESTLGQMKQAAAQSGDEQEEVDEDAQRKEAEEQAAQRLRLRFLIDAIAKEENVTVEPNEISGELRMFQAYSGLSDKEFSERFDRDALIERIYMSNLHNKVLSKVIEEANVTEKSADNG